MKILGCCTFKQLHKETELHIYDVKNTIFSHHFFVSLIQPQKCIFFRVIFFSVEASASLWETNKKIQNTSANIFWYFNINAI